MTNNYNICVRCIPYYDYGFDSLCVSDVSDVSDQDDNLHNSDQEYNLHISNINRFKIFTVVK